MLCEAEGGPRDRVENVRSPLGARMAPKVPGPGRPHDPLDERVAHTLISPLRVPAAPLAAVSDPQGEPVMLRRADG